LRRRRRRLSGLRAHVRSFETRISLRRGSPS